MNARIEAAAKAGHSHVYGDDHFDFLPDHAKDRHRETISAALAAADAVMFSEAVLEQAETAVSTMRASGYVLSRDLVAAVVAELKGDA